MSNKKDGFTLIEVIVAIVIFAFGVLSLAAFASLNYMYLRVNQSKAKIHVLTESTIEDIQNWVREPPNANGPTIFDSLWTAVETGSIIPNDTIRTYISSSNLFAKVVFDTTVGASASATDAKILVHIIATGTSGERQTTEITDFCLANYKVGD